MTFSRVICDLHRRKYVGQVLTCWATRDTATDGRHYRSEAEGDVPDQVVPHGSTRLHQQSQPNLRDRSDVLVQVQVQMVLGSVFG